MSSTIESMATNLLDQVGQIVESIDDQWIEFSINDIMSSDMLSVVDSSTRRSITSAYECAIDTLNQMPEYSSEFSNLYTNNPFVILTAGQNSFYNISFDADKLANYLNAISQTQFAQNLASCFNTTIPSQSDFAITADDLAPALEYLPQISAKFDGIFDHHLTELKMSEQNDYYSISSDLSFSYPTNLNVSAPTNTRPIMEIVNDVYQQIENLLPSVTTQTQTTIVIEE